MAEKLSGGMKLTLIQNEMKAPKTQYNQFGKFNYRTTDEIQYFLKPLCAKYHTQVVPSTECVWLGSDARGAFFQKAMVSMVDADSGELIAESTAMAREDDDRKGMSAPQASAAAAQFAVKRALEQLLMLDGSAPEVDAMRPTNMTQQVPQPRRTAARPAQTAPQASQGARQPRQAQVPQPTVKAPQTAQKQAPKAAANTTIKQPTPAEQAADQAWLHGEVQ